MFLLPWTRALEEKLPKVLRGIEGKEEKLPNVPLHSIHVLELNYVDNTDDSWIVDLGAMDS